MEKQKDFSDQKRIDSQPENSLSGDSWCSTKHKTELHGLQTESLKFLRFATSCLNSITCLGHLIGVKKQRKFCRYVTCSQLKGEFWIQEVITSSFGHLFTSFNDG